MLELFPAGFKQTKTTNKKDKAMHTNDFFDLYELADKQKNNYEKSSPFPHIVIDQFLPKTTYNRIKKAFPKNNDEIWKTPSNIHTIGKSVTKNGSLGLKELGYSKDAQDFFRQLNSGLFLTFLERLTGIEGLLPDPYFSEGGFHRMTKDGYLDVHADFSHSDKLGLERRLNLIIYLNDGWLNSYGGDLGLYDKEVHKEVSIAPVGNRAVIFTTSDHSYHGHPDPLTCPKNRYRRSVALYYYSLPTADRKKSRILFPDDTKFSRKATAD